MCDIGTAGLILSAGTGLYGVAQSAGIARQNAAFARYEAAQMAEIGKANEMRARDRMSRLIARQRAQLATRGVRLDSVSAQDLGGEAGAEAHIEAQAQRLNTESRVIAKTNEATIYDNTARANMLNGIFGTASRTMGQALELWPELQGA